VGEAHVTTLRAAITSLVFLLLIAVLYVFFIRTTIGQQLDQSSFTGVFWLRHPLGVWASRLRLALLVLTGLMLLALVIRGLVRRSFRAVLCALGIAGVTLLVSSALKDAILTRPYLGPFGYIPNTFPSNHEAVTTAALIGSFLLLGNRRLHSRGWVALVVLGAVSGLIQVVAYAHRPSDVLAGALLAGAVAVWFPSGERQVGRRWYLAGWVFTASAALVGAVLLAGWELSGYAGSDQLGETAGILACAAACVCASLTVGAHLVATPPDVARAGVAQPDSTSMDNTSMDNTRSDNTGERTP
jgi:membrane-associated phospholipid phosphatase